MTQDRKHNLSRAAGLIIALAVIAVLSACARMGNPDGGWYDETPPYVVGAVPAEGAVGVRQNKLHIYFNEYIKLDNASEKVIVSPPQLEQPEITAQGKRIVINLKDTLKPNTTYTVDFSDAISDNNEGNPMGNYAYVFSTGDSIDTLQVAGQVIAADNLEPVKGILVGLYDNLSDTAFTKTPMVRVARTDSRGRFVIKGVASGRYRVCALQDADGNYAYSQKSEMLAIGDDLITPSSFMDTRRDTLWRDSLHILSITPVKYTHFMPDNITLLAWTARQTDRYLVKVQRQEPECITVFFSYGDRSLPVVRGLNFNADNAFLVQSNEKRDTVRYWLRDTSLVNRDTLSMAITYMRTDSLGQLQQQTDTFDVLPKMLYARRLKMQEEKYKSWLKDQRKNRRKGEPVDSVMPPDPIQYEVKVNNEIAPDENVLFVFKRPLASADTSKIHLYSNIDSVWYKAPFRFVPLDDHNRKMVQRHLLDSLHAVTDCTLQYAVIGEWRPGVEYSLEVDSAAFVDLYGLTNKPKRYGLKVRDLDQFASIVMTIDAFQGKHVVMQLLNGQDEPVKSVETDDGQAEFFYISPGTYYMRLFVDENNNGEWDTGDYDTHRKPEPVYYYPEKIECRAKWDLDLKWSPLAKPINDQKPAAITKQKAEKEKTVKHRNADRAKKLDIAYNPDNIKM